MSTIPDGRQGKETETSVLSKGLYVFNAICQNPHWDFHVGGRQGRIHKIGIVSQMTP